MLLQLPNHLWVCAVSDRHIFLDLDRDRYFHLPEPDAALFRALLTDSQAVPKRFRRLVESGVLVPAPAGKPLALTLHPPAERSMLETWAAKPRPIARDIVNVWRLLRAARGAIRRKSLPKAFASLPPRSADPAGCDAEARDRLVARFLAARPFVPIAPNCLQDSLALRWFLGRKGVAADLVIGVKLHPFGAHCWVQSGTVALNETVAGARMFSPLLVA